MKSNDAIDSSVLGESMLNYSHDGAEDVKRTVLVIDTTAPSIALNEHANGGTDEVKVTVGQELADPGLTLTDAGDSAPYWTTDREYTPNQLELFGFSITPATMRFLISVTMVVSCRRFQMGVPFSEMDQEIGVLTLNQTQTFKTLVSV